MPLDSARFPLKRLIETFCDAASQREDIRLVLTGRRTPGEMFPLWSYVDARGFRDRVSFLPYYHQCRDFPVKKHDCWRWIGRDIEAADLDASALLSEDGPCANRTGKLALFVTSIHPEHLQGNSRLMRLWLDHLKMAGYRVHLLHYATDAAYVTDDMRVRAGEGIELYREIAVTAGLVGADAGAANVHVDDWCGTEAIEAVSALAGQYEYDVAIVNYAFMSAAFNALAAYTRKILLTHDGLSDRNRRILAQGYPSAAPWISLDPRGERQAFLRADAVVALQALEAEEFRRLCGDAAKVRLVSPVFPVAPAPQAPPPADRLRIGYMAARNLLNVTNLAQFLRAWLADPELRGNSEIVIAGWICADFAALVEGGATLLEDAAPQMLGAVGDPALFFDKCDLVINPDGGGTGVKIKTLEAMAARRPVVTTAAGAVGVDSPSRFHAAPDIGALVRLLAEIARDPSLLDAVRRETADAYDRYAARNEAAMNRLFGSASCEADAPENVRAPGGSGPNEGARGSNKGGEIAKSLAESLTAIGYIVLPFSMRRRMKRQMLMDGLRRR